MDEILDLRKRFQTEMPIGEEDAKSLAWHGQRAFELMSDGRISKLGIEESVKLTLMQLRMEQPKLTGNELKGKTA